MSGFEDFWQAYPRRVGKLAALREWNKLNPSPEVQRQMAAALEWQREQWDDPQFIPHPRTWLHQGRWMDEPPARKLSNNLRGIAEWLNDKRAANE